MNREVLIFEKDLPVGKFTVYSERPSETIVRPRQIHGSRVIHIDEISESEKIEADGVYQEFRNLFRPISIVTADCLPLVALGKHGVSIMHAGWRGISKRIYLNENVMALMPYYFFIGPSIGSCCYEVGDDFSSNFGENSFIRRDGSLYFDLQKELKTNIENSYKNAKVEVANICNCCNLKFHSYRRDGKKGHNWNIFSM